MNPRPFVIAGVLLGAGLGGFADGILLHQILQTHNMLSARRPPTDVANIKINMVWDGVFHAGTWALTLAGVVALFGAGRMSGPEPRFWSARALAGAMLVGWGLFNLVEGVIDHHLLHLHHVVEARGVSVFDWLFLAAGAAMLAIGAWLVRSSLRPTAPPR